MRYSFGSMLFPRLWRFSLKRLFGVLEGVFNRPAPGVYFNDMFRQRMDICCAEEVVGFLAIRVAANHQQNRRLGFHPIP